MKILIVSQYFWPEDFKVNDIAFDFVERGHQVTVLTAKPNYPKGKFYKGYALFSKKREVYKKVDIIRTPIIPRRGGGAFFLALNYLSFVFFSFFTARFRVKGPYDIIFCHLTSPITAALPAIWLKKKFNIPLVLWVLDLWPESVESTTTIKSKRFYTYLNKLVSHIYTSADQILVSSHSFIDSIKEKLDKEFVSLNYFPNWAEDVFIQNSFVDQKPIGLPEGCNIMFAGNIGEAQDFESIVKAAKMTESEQINWVIVGDGRKKQWLEDAIAKNKSSNIYLLGRHPLERMPQFFKQADAMLISLKDEPIFKLTVPAKIQAYMASGKIILGMVNGEAKNLIEKSGCGYTASAGDFQTLAKNAIKLKAMKTLEKKVLENNALEFYENNFSKAMLFDQLESILNNQ